MIKKGDKVRLASIWNGATIREGRVTKVVKLKRAIPFGVTKRKRYCEIDGSGLYAEDILKKV